MQWCLAAIRIVRTPISRIRHPVAITIRAGTITVIVTVTVTRTIAWSASVAIGALVVICHTPTEQQATYG